MANEPKEDDIVHGKDLLTRALDAFFGKVGETIHGAAKKDSAKDGKTTQDGKAPQVIETDGEASNDAPPSTSEASGSETPSQVA